MLGALTAQRFDILVIGGGIHGAFAAWDAASRGLRVALVERGDFGAAASANSLKIVHGGFRYLQRFDVARLRTSSAERERLARMAPHLVSPMACIVPTESRVSRSRLALGTALALHRVLSAAPGRTDDAPHRFPPGRLVTLAEYRRLAAPFVTPAATGGALWHDARLESPDRFLIAVIDAARREGAVVANYVEALRLLRDTHGVCGACVRDEAGDEAELSARLVLIAANAASHQLAPVPGDGGPVPARRSLPPFASACNVVFDRPAPNVAVAIPVRAKARRFFAVPWRGLTMVGTTQHPIDAGTGPRMADVAARELIAAVNDSIPGAALSEREVRLVHRGLLPGTAERLADAPILIDHAACHGVPGAVTMIGVKWTTARRVAELAVDLCVRRLGRARRAGHTAHAVLPASRYTSLADLAAEPSDALANAGVAVVERLKVLYGSDHRAVARLAADCPALATPLGESLTIGAQVVYAIRHEMARHLDDIVLRRTELGSAGHPGVTALSAAAAVAAAELRWSDARIGEEIARAVTYYPDRT